MTLLCSESSCGSHLTWRSSCDPQGLHNCPTAPPYKLIFSYFLPTPPLTLGNLCSADRLNTLLPQGLCTHCFLCLQDPSSRYPSLPYRGLTEMPLGGSSGPLSCSLILFNPSKVLLAQSCSTLCDPVDHQAPRSTEFSSKNTGVGCHVLLQGIFPTQGLKPGLLFHRQILYRLSHQGPPLVCVNVPPLLDMLWGLC